MVAMSEHKQLVSKLASVPEPERRGHHPKARPWKAEARMLADRAALRRMVQWKAAGVTNSRAQQQVSTQDTVSMSLGEFVEIPHIH